MNRPLVAITMGDPAGVGPETIAKAYPHLCAPHSNSGQETKSCQRFFVLGNSAVMTKAVKVISGNLIVRSVSSTDQIPNLIDSKEMYCLDCAPQADQVAPATIDAKGGQAAFLATKLAAELALAGKIDSVVTAPLHKEALHLAGHHWPGHTELLGDLCQAKNVAMMLYLPPYSENEKKDPACGHQRWPLSELGLGVAHATLHIALQDAIETLTCDRIVQTGNLVHKVTRAIAESLNVDRKINIATAALNPHGGENGLFGRQEIDLIQPAVEIAKKKGIPMSPPLPCDTMMLKATQGQFDGVVAMYHDQGHIPLKLLGMHRAVNITLGLPIVRTSVAHGTAFDLAWTGKVNHESLLHAAKVAGWLAGKKIRW